MEDEIKKPIILIVEDDLETARLNSRMIRRRGYEVYTAQSAAEARSLVREIIPDLFVLDIVLPDGDGLSLCREFRQTNDAPILFLTGKKSTEDKVAGLSEGGDYYLTKPYAIDEFLAVIDRLLHRTQQVNKKIIEASIISCGPLLLNINQRTACINGRDVGLTAKEFAILHLLVRNEDVEVPSELIYETVWHTPMSGDTGALRVQIARLKKKLDEENTDDFSILRKHGKGYTFTTK